MSEKPRIAVLCGGTSLERDVSLRSGIRVTNTLSDAGYDVTKIDVGGDLVATLRDGSFDAAFIALHGAAGEDGTVQSLLELLNLPYTGPDALASTLAWNKPTAQGLFERHGLTVPRHVSLSQLAFRELGASAAIDHIVDTLGDALVVKPARGGSSIGLTILQNPTELPAAIMSAFSCADVVLIEQAITGKEIAITVLDGQPLPAVEIQPKRGSYDFSARYTAGATEFHAPARVDEAVSEACAEAATRAYAAVGARHISRVDAIIDASGVPYVIELDTCPGLTQTSLVPLAAEAAEMSFTDLCTRLVAFALRDA